jgi:hypothetical protein
MAEPFSHLVSRFFDVLFARPLIRSERAAVEAWLGPSMSSVFYQQADPDQRHGYHSALTVVALGIGDREIIQSALLHDVGKRHARLGVIGRSVASLLKRLGLPLTDRMSIYIDHGLHAARELAELGAPPLAIDFALHHHGERPDSIDPETWQTLLTADQPPKTGRKAGRGIFSPAR